MASTLESGQTKVAFIIIPARFTLSSTHPTPMHTLELYRTRGTTWPRYGWRLRSSNGKIVAGDMHQTYSKVASVKRVLDNLWPDYYWDWSFNIAWFGAPECVRFRLVDNTAKGQS